jgi:hypothetical protein
MPESIQDIIDYDQTYSGGLGCWLYPWLAWLFEGEKSTQAIPWLVHVSFNSGFNSCNTQFHLSGMLLGVII